MLWVWGGALLVGFSFILKNIILIVVFFLIANSFQYFMVSLKDAGGV